MAARPYVLLRDAMHESGLVAVVRLALRTRESLAVLRVRDQVIADRETAGPARAW
jgi:DNA end-binding protein Ku